jgi:hypothetical protein
MIGNAPFPQLRDQEKELPSVRLSELSVFAFEILFLSLPGDQSTWIFKWNHEAGKITAEIKRVLGFGFSTRHLSPNLFTTLLKSVLSVQSVVPIFPSTNEPQPTTPASP